MFPPDERRTNWWLRTAVRSGLFPLILIVLLVYLAGQTLLGNDGGSAREVTYSEAKSVIRESPQRIDLVTFIPKRQRMDVTMNDGTALEASYPGDASAAALEALMDEHTVAHDSEGTGESAWWSLVKYLLPFTLFFAFWVFLMRNMERERAPMGATRDRTE